jgi:hypothetical protein
MTSSEDDAGDQWSRQAIVKFCSVLQRDFVAEIVMFLLDVCALVHTEADSEDKRRSLLRFCSGRKRFKVLVTASAMITFASAPTSSTGG